MEPQTAPAITGLMDPTPNGATLEQSMGFTMGQSLKATAADTFVSNPAMALRDMYEYGSDRFVREKDLTAEEANNMYGHVGLSFDRPVSRHYADILAEQKRQEITRQNIIAHGPQGIGATAARLAVGLGVSALDPINLASAFIPPLGATRLASMAGITSRVGVRALEGAVGGFLGAAAVEPLVYAGAQARQADYSLTDSMLNLTFGTALGSGIHVLGGYVSDNFLNRKATSMLNPGDVRMPKPTNTGEVVEQMPPEQRENAVRAAVGQAVSGKAVDIAPIMQTAPQQVATNLAGSVQTVYDAAGRSYDTQFEVVDAADLVAANGDLQPRDRSRVGSDDQINRLAQDMVPERLAESTDAATGAPIVGPDNVVESGNGRVSFIRQAYANGYASADKYKAFLKSRGVDISQFKQPILVRRRISELSDDERKAFVVNAQAVGTMALSASERASADARLVDKALEVASLDSPNLRAGTSLKFVRSFLAQIPQSERAGLITGGGELAQAGIARMKNGLLARAFDDADLLNSVLEETDDGLRTLGNTLYEVSIPWADMRNSVRAGELSPYVDATDDLLNAVRFLRRAKDQGLSFREAVEQGELGGIKGRDARTLESNQFLSLMLRDNGKGDFRLLSKEQLAERIGRYVDIARNTAPTNDMFGAPPATASDVLTTLRNEIETKATREGLKPDLIDVPQGGIVRPKEAFAPKDAPKLDVEGVRKQVFDDVLPAEQKPANPYSKDSSWVIKNKATGEVIMETFDRKKVDALNTDKYEAVPIYDHLTSLNKKPEYATKDNTPPERRTMPKADDLPKLDAIEGDSMATHASLEQATQVVSAKEAELDADIADLENMLKGMGDMTEAEKNSLAEADGFINNQPSIREAIMAAATCIIGK